MTLNMQVETHTFFFSGYPLTGLMHGCVVCTSLVLRTTFGIKGMLVPLLSDPSVCVLELKTLMQVLMVILLEQSFLLLFYFDILLRWISSINHLSFCSLNLHTGRLPFAISLNLVWMASVLLLLFSNK